MSTPPVYVARKDLPEVADSALCDGAELKSVVQRVFAALVEQLGAEGVDDPDVICLILLEPGTYDMAPSIIQNAQRGYHEQYAYIVPLTDREGYLVAFSE